MDRWRRVGCGATGDLRSSRRVCERRVAARPSGLRPYESRITRREGGLVDCRTVGRVRFRPHSRYRHPSKLTIPAQPSPSPIFDVRRTTGRKDVIQPALRSSNAELSSGSVLARMNSRGATHDLRSSRRTTKHESLRDRTDFALTSHKSRGVRVGW